MRRGRPPRGPKKGPPGGTGASSAATRSSSGQTVTGTRLPTRRQGRPAEAGKDAREGQTGRGGGARCALEGGAERPGDDVRRPVRRHAVEAALVGEHDRRDHGT